VLLIFTLVISCFCVYIYRKERTARTGQAGQTEQDCQHRTVREALLEPDSQSKTDRTKQQGQESGYIQPGQDSGYRQPEKDSEYRQPEKDCQHSTIRTGLLGQLGQENQKRTDKTARTGLQCRDWHDVTSKRLRALKFGFQCYVANGGKSPNLCFFLLCAALPLFSAHVFLRAPSLFFWPLAYKCESVKKARTPNSARYNSASILGF
jgi:hypothetical protein